VACRWQGDAVTDLEATFDTRWRQLGGPELAPLYRYNGVPNQHIDRAHVEARVAIEIDGGTWKEGGGGHNTGVGYRRGCIKGNELAALGWAVFRLTSDMLRDAPAQHLAQIIATIENRLQFGLDVWVANE
jgi:very-short-patch-repair endonuclease